MEDDQKHFSSFFSVHSVVTVAYRVKFQTQCEIFVFAKIAYVC